jgi:hypothetical protein
MTRHGQAGRGDFIGTKHLRHGWRWRDWTGRRCLSCRNTWCGWLRGRSRSGRFCMHAFCRVIEPRGHLPAHHGCGQNACLTKLVFIFRRQWWRRTNRSRRLGTVVPGQCGSRRRSKRQRCGPISGQRIGVGVGQVVQIIGGVWSFRRRTIGKTNRLARIFDPDEYRSGLVAAVQRQLPPKGHRTCRSIRVDPQSIGHEHQFPRRKSIDFNTGTRSYPGQTRHQSLDVGMQVLEDDRFITSYFFDKLIGRSGLEIRTIEIRAQR